MPNYSHGTKLTLASIEEPPYLTIGTDVSAKYKGAFCEAKITDVNKHVKLRVLFDGGTGTHLIDDTDLKTGSTIETGSRIEAKHPEKKQQTYVLATITKVLDHSRYTVVFDDGDQCVLRRNSLCLKSGKHFAESETLDQLPLTNPEHFGNPVKVGAVDQTNHTSGVQNTSSTSTPAPTSINNKTQTNNHIQSDDKPRGKSSSATTSSSTNSEDSKSNTTSGNEPNNNTNRKRQHQQLDNGNETAVKKLKKERNSATTNSTTNTSNNSTPGRRGATKGRKRRESINNGSKQADIDEASIDDSIDSSDANLGEINVKLEAIEVGVKLMVQYGKGKAQNVYEAKVNKIETNSSGKTRYFVHYTGWNNRYDEWITRNRILSIVTEKENGTRDGRLKHSDTSSTNSTAQTSTSNAQSSTNNSSATTTTAPSTNKEKEKESTISKTRRSRHSEVAANSSTNTGGNSGSGSSNATSAVSSSTNPPTEFTTSKTSTVISNPTHTPPTPLKSAAVRGTGLQTTTISVTTSNPPSHSNSNHVSKEKEKEISSKTRRSRQMELSNTNPSTVSILVAPQTSKPVGISTTTIKDEPAQSALSETAPITSSITTTTSSSSTTPAASSLPNQNNITPSKDSKEKETPVKPRRSKYSDHTVAETKPNEPQGSSEVLSTNPPSINERTQSKLRERYTATKTRRSARPTKLKYLKDSTRGHSTKATNSSTSNSGSSSDEEIKKSTCSVNNNIGSSSSEGSVDDSSQDNELQDKSHMLNADSTKSSGEDRVSPNETITKESEVTLAIPPSANNVLISSSSTSISSSSSSSSTISTSTLSEASSSLNHRQADIRSISTTLQPVDGTTTPSNNTTVTSEPAAEKTNGIGKLNEPNNSDTNSPVNREALVVSPGYRQTFKFCEDIDESDCDKKISILQERIMALRQAYMSLKSQLADLDRKKKRPRSEKSNSEHLNSCSLTCRN